MKKKICTILIVVLVAVLGASTYFIIDHYKESNKQAALYGELAELVDAAAQTDAATEPAEQIPYSEEKMLLPELAELYQQNGDLVGWISIADTNINYPVMQSVNEPNFYLKHGFDKEYSDYGCPYVQEDCDVQEPSDNLVIYGHHMSNGSMFAHLEKFKSKDFWSEHRMITFNTLTDKQEYEIVAVFRTVVYTDSPEAFKFYRFIDAESANAFDDFMENSLSRMRPHLVSEWSEKNFPLTPDTVTFGSNKIVWWKGACGHEWQTSIKARSAGEQCPICSGARVLRGYNDFESKFPELAKEWSPKNEPLRPSMITAATHRKVIWQCKLGHEWTASVKSRTVNGTGCPYCSHNFVLPGFNDLASRFPEIAAEWSERNLPLTPDQVTAFKNIKVWWKCHLGHEWNTLISTRAGGSQCPYCSGIKLLKGFNDLKTKYPFLAAEWSEKNLPLTPDAVNEKSTKNVWWKCNTCGYEWKAVVKARVKGGMCPVCAERAVLQGYNDLGTTDPYLLSEWDYEKNSKWTPSNVSRNSMKVVWWKCGAGHSYRAKITDRTIEQKGCPQCEAEFQQALPQMLIMMYGAQNGITVKSNSDSELGMRLVAYLPELHCAVDIAGATVTEKREQSVKAHICLSNRLGYYLIKRTADASQMAAEIKTLFIRNHIYLHTDSEKDVQMLRERFLEWKYRNACKLNGKY